LNIDQKFVGLRPYGHILASYLSAFLSPVSTGILFCTYFLLILALRV
jgi:hypothetical protein